MGKLNRIFVIPVVFLLVVFLNTNLFSEQVDSGKPSLKLLNLSSTSTGDPKFEKTEDVGCVKRSAPNKNGLNGLNPLNGIDGFASLNPSYPPQSTIQNLSQTTTGDPQLQKAEVLQKTKKLQMPFIANEGQTDAKVAFYANTFGGTVFVTKDGDIVYSLPSGRDVPGGASQEAGRGGRQGFGGELHSPDHAPCRDTEPRVPMSPLQYLASLTHSPKGDVLCRVSEKRESRIMDYVSWFEGCAPDGRKMGLHVSDSPRGWDTERRVPTVNLCEDTASRVPTTAARRDTASRVPGVALKEEFVGAVGAKVKTIQGEQPSITKVNYFKGNDPSKWKTNVSAYDFVNLGEIYKGIELKLKAYGDNVEKLFYVKPGADPEQIKISLSGIQPSECKGKQPPESP